MMKKIAAATIFGVITLASSHSQCKESVKTEVLLTELGRYSMNSEKLFNDACRNLNGKAIQLEDQELSIDVGIAQATPTRGPVCSINLSLREDILFRFRVEANPKKNSWTTIFTAWVHPDVGDNLICKYMFGAAVDDARRTFLNDQSVSMIRTSSMSFAVRSEHNDATLLKYEWAQGANNTCQMKLYGVKK